MSKNKVKVIIPVYKSRPSDNELRSIDNTVRQLAAHPLALLVPGSIDTSLFSSRYPGMEIMAVSDEWLGSKNGIAGYNRMMMSEEFYAMFDGCDYILICHSDAWIFRDELSDWCDRGFDIVAPPWPTRPRYRRFPLRQLIALRKRLSRGFFRALTYDKVGNGGLSLRKVASCRKACRDYRDTIEKFLSRSGNPLQNEDVFWALVPESFRYPDVKTAMQFGFDYRPSLCYTLSGNRLPMGCHGYTKRRHIKFWKQFIPNL